jgi:hypothetical protein
LDGHNDRACVDLDALCPARAGFEMTAVALRSDLKVPA